MSGYLLLRDNKQTGPYSCEEIIAKGFKAYDLIWAEGKSAGWRYPSEFPEFAKHAPVIEEQPFDRFYKKPSTSTTNTQLEGRSNTTPHKPVDKNPPVSEIETNTTLEPEIPKIESRPAKLVAQEKKKIFVTLPSETNARPTPNTKKELEIPPVSRVDSIPEGIIAELNNKQETKTEKQVPIEEKAKETVNNAPKETIPVPTIKEEPSWSQYNLQEKTANKPTELTTEKYKQEKKPDSLSSAKTTLLESRANKTDKNQMIIRAAVAICLLLGGVVIGLAISTSKHAAQQEGLSKLVNEKIEQSKTGRPVENTEINPPVNAEPVPPASNETTPAAVQDELIKSTVQSDNSTKKSEAIQAIKKETDKATPGKEENVALVDKKPAEPVHKEDPATETARKNIYNLVSVSGNKYKVGVLGGISNLELTLSNNSLYPIDEVEVVVNYHGPEKRIVRKETVTITDIAAGTQKVVPVPKSKRGVSVSYTINKINSKALGLAHAGL